MACFVSILTHHFHHSKIGHTHTRTHTIELNVLYCVRWCICLRVEWFRIINSQWTGIIYTELSMNHNEHDPANTCKTMCENTVEICLSISPCSSLSVCPSALCECEWCTVKIHLFLSVAIKILWFASMYLSFSLRFFCAALQNQPFYLFLLHWCFQLQLVMIYELWFSGYLSFKYFGWVCVRVCSLLFGGVYFLSWPTKKDT